MFRRELYKALVLEIPDLQLVLGSVLLFFIFVVLLWWFLVQDFLLFINLLVSIDTKCLSHHLLDRLGEVHGVLQTETRPEGGSVEHHGGHFLRRLVLGVVLHSSQQLLDQRVAVLNIMVAISFAVLSSGLSSTLLNNSLIRGCQGLISRVFFWLR